MPDPIIVTKQLLEDFYDETASTYDTKGLMKECGQRLVDHLGGIGS